VIYKKPAWFFIASFFALLSSLVTYVYGFLAAPFFNPTDPEKLCVGIRVRPPGTSQDLFPLSYQCLGQDGTHTELVPTWINPLIFTLVAFAVVLFALGVNAAEPKQANRNPGANSDDR
jgi:hypothetical protein